MPIKPRILCEGKNIFLHSIFFDDVKPIRQCPFNHCRLSIAPGHFDLRRSLDRSKYSHHLVARQIPASTQHLLNLRKSSIHHLHFCPSSTAVFPRASQLHRDPWRPSLVPENRCRLKQIVDHHIQVPIVIEVPQSHSL